MSKPSRDDAPDWQAMIDSMAFFSNPSTTAATMSTDKMPTLEQLSATMQAFEILFPLDEVITRIELDPAAYCQIRKRARQEFRTIPDTLGGIMLAPRHDLPEGCQSHWFADGHFEIRGCNFGVTE